MDCFNGIPIEEYRLLISDIAYTILAVVALVLIAVMIYLIKTGVSFENKENIKKLREKAETCDIAKKRLKRIERRIKRKNKENRPDFIISCIILFFSIIIFSFSSVLGAIPGWIDYAEKDYVVYTGSIEVRRSGRTSYIRLEDGTELDGHACFNWEDTNGTVVYAKRSKIAIGGIRDENK